MAVNVAISGFGRIGRLVLRSIIESKRKDINVVAINDLAPIETNAFLLANDTVHGPLNEKVSFKRNKMIVGSKNITVLNQRDPQKLPWKRMKIDVALECTGLFTSKDKAAMHIKAGEKKVLVSAPCTNADKTIVYGVNEDEITKTRLVDKKTNQMLLRVDEDDYCKRVKNDVITKLGDYDAVVISDYDKGFLTESSIKYLIAKYPMTFIDSKKLFNKWINGVTFLKINEVEYNRNRKNLKDYKGNLIVTLGEKGVDFNGTIIPPKRQAEVSDLSGAGDTFFAAFVCGILKNKGIKSSIDFAQDCALSAIEKKGVVII